MNILFIDTTDSNKQYGPYDTLEAQKDESGKWQTVSGNWLPKKNSKLIVSGSWKFCQYLVTNIDESEVVPIIYLGLIDDAR